MSHVEGEDDADLHDAQGRHKVRLRGERFSSTLGYDVMHGKDVEYNERAKIRLERHLDLHRKQGMQWRVEYADGMKPDGAVTTLRARAVVLDDVDVDTSNPVTAWDWACVMLGEAGYESAPGIAEWIDVVPGVTAIWSTWAPIHPPNAVPNRQDTGIRIVDAWMHGQ